MHELYVAESIHRIAVEEASRAGATRIASVTVEVGALSGVATASLEIAFPAVCRGGPAEHAHLTIETIPGAGHCPGCCAEFEISDFLSSCPSCGHVPVEVTAGRELRLKQIEVG